MVFWRRRMRWTACFYNGLLLLSITLIIFMRRHNKQNSTHYISFDKKFWFMPGGKIFPTEWTDKVNLWYDKDLGTDRIVEQLMFSIDTSISYNSSLEAGQNTSDLPVANMTSEYHGDISTFTRYPIGENIRTIGLYNWNHGVPFGREVFLEQNCPVNACHIVDSSSDPNFLISNGVRFSDKPAPNQVRMMYLLESPLNAYRTVREDGSLLTATYRHDSDIVTPYEKWVYYNESVRTLPQTTNYAEGKRRKVAWFVSNCHPRNNRDKYVEELAKYIDVHIFGDCGNLTCARKDQQYCFEMLARHYKFYLSFENSNCRDYITEKFFVNGLSNKVLPIVMGAHPDDYKRVAPHQSFIHVEDFASPKELANYLHKLDQNDDLYNAYFQWKGTGEFVNTNFLCRVCAMAHYSYRFPKKPSHKYNFAHWWKNDYICTDKPWRSTPDIFAPENYHKFLTA